MRELTLNLYNITRCTHNYYARRLGELGITMGQFPFLLGIAENDGVSQEKLSAMLAISKSTTALIVGQLVKAGLVTRETDLADRRNFCLHAAAKTLELVPKIYSVIDECHNIITAGLSPAERKTFETLTGKVRVTTERAIGRKNNS